MSKGYQFLDAATLRTAAEQARRELADNVLVGLSEKPKRLSSRFIYDDRGSELFARITELDVYYPTACEFEILRTNARAILDQMGGRPFDLVDLGAGDGRKTMVLLQAFAEAGADVRFVPIDISEGAMRGLVDKVRGALPQVPVAGLVSEYMDGLTWLSLQEPERGRLILFLGSNIGNFSRPQARSMLRRLWNAARHDDRVLIGFDLKKDIEVLLAAYNDHGGVTAQFNKNLLERINRELDADFDVDRFRHYATYNVFSGAMESYLVSMASQTVNIGAVDTEFSFDAWEPIHTEYSYKYLVSDVEGLIGDTGYVLEDKLFDSRRWFLDAICRVEKR